MKKSPVGKLAIGGAAIFLLGIFIGTTLSETLGSNNESYEVRLGGGVLTNPLLECELGENTIASKKVDFTPEMKSFVEKLETTPGVSNVSVYFRDLNNGPIVGVNQDGNFAPASLLKVPVLISYLKWAEEQPEVLSEEMVFSIPVDVGYEQQFAPSVPLEVGTVYTAKELLEIMTKYSDNQALILLYERLPPSYQEELYTLLGVDPKLITDPTARLTIRQYSIFFRILFNASFLSRAHSEYALDLLAQTTFEDGVRASVPSTITVAHKFGERKTSGDLQQFHDCGIVYYPYHPYLLCVMTRGEDVEALIEAIAKTSKFVYHKVDEQYGK